MTVFSGRIHGHILGLTSGLHGFHIHQSGATGEDCKAAGGHFNPAEVRGREAGSSLLCDWLISLLNGWLIT